MASFVVGGGSKMLHSAKFPYLLPPNHPFTALIVHDTHRKQLHSGVNSTVTALCQNFWITSIRQYVRKLLRTCVACRKLEGAAFRAPWYGGFWERLIGLTKKAIKKTQGRALITLTELQTLAVEVVAILNECPITHVSSNVSDEEH